MSECFGSCSRWASARPVIGKTDSWHLNASNLKNLKVKINLGSSICHMHAVKHSNSPGWNKCRQTKGLRLVSWPGFRNETTDSYAFMSATLIQWCFLLCVPQRPAKWMRLFWSVRFMQYSSLLLFLLFNRWHKNANKCVIHSLSFTSKDSGLVSKKAALHFLGIWTERSSRKHIKHCRHTFGYLLTAW